LAFDPAVDEDFRGQRVIGMAAAIVPLTSSRALTIEDMGLVLRSDAGDVALTVPGTLPEGFNCTVSDWGGRITLLEGDGATNQGFENQTTAYETLTLMVIRNVDGNSAEFVLMESGVTGTSGTLLGNLADYGAVADGDTDLTPAITAALADGIKTMVLDQGSGDYVMRVGTTLGNNVSLVAGDGMPTILVDLNSGSRAFTLTGRQNVRIAGIRFDGQYNGTRNDALMVLSGASRCVIRDCEFYKIPCAGTGGIVISGNGERNEVSYNRFDEAAGTTIGCSNGHRNRILYNELYDCGHEVEGFGIRIGEGSHRNLVHGNHVERQGIEGIGTYWNTYLNRITDNHCEECGDNGISISGYQSTVHGNTCIDNERAGIGIWGSFNTVTGNICLRNGTEQEWPLWRNGLVIAPGGRVGYSGRIYSSVNGGTTATGSEPVHTSGTVTGADGVDWTWVASISYWSGVWVACGYGGTGQYNTIGNNILDDDGATADERTQYFGVRIQTGNGYTAWDVGQTISAGTYRVSGLHIYVATTSGTTGATAPTHTSGDASDGGVTWNYRASFISSAFPRGNVVFGNTSLRTKSGQTYSDGLDWLANSLFAHQTVSMPAQNISLPFRLEFDTPYADDAAAAAAGVDVGHMYVRTTGLLAQRLT
jgi:hypothetical protein